MSAPVCVRSSFFRPGLTRSASSLALMLAATPAFADDPLPEVIVMAPADSNAPASNSSAVQAPEGSAASGYRTSTGNFGPLGNIPLKELPFSLNVTPGQLIENTNAHSIGEAIKTNPTATLLMSSAGYSSMSRILVRGFNASDQNEKRDGLVDRSFAYVPLENVERIEILNGFSAFLNGFASPGGSVDYISKDPTQKPLATLATGFYGGGIGFVHGDFGGKVAETDNRLGYRINLYQEDGSRVIANSDQNREFVSGRFTYDLTPGTRLWADAYHQHLLMHGLQTYFNLASGVSIPDASRFVMSRQYGQNWTWNEAEKSVAGFGFDSHLNDTFTLRGGFRYGTMWRHYGYIAATLTDNAGNYTEKYTTSPTQTEYTRSEYALLDARIPTWTVVHNLTMGFTGTDYLYSRGADVSSGLYKSTIDSSITFAQPNLTLGGLNQWQQQIFTNLLVADRMEVTEKLSLLGGVNFAQIQQRAWGSGVVISTSNYRASGLTPTAGFTYKILPNVVGYASYMQSLQNGDTAPSTAANAYAVLAPSVSQQYETGLKTTLGEVNLNVALFRINKVNAELNPNNNIYMQDGREIHQGVEVTFAGNLMDGLNAVGGFTLMHAYVDQATALPLTVGKTPVNVPEEQARLRLEYALPFARDIKVSFGPNFLGRRPIDVYDQQYIKPVTLFDGGIRYESEAWGHKITANVTVDNIFNQAYWAYYRSGDGLLLGNPRTVALTVKATW